MTCVFALHKSFIIRLWHPSVVYVSSFIIIEWILLKLIVFCDSLALCSAFGIWMCDDLVSYKLTWRKHFVFFNCFATFDMENMDRTVCTVLSAHTTRTKLSSTFFFTCHEYFWSDSNIHKFIAIRCAICYFR